MLRNVAEDVGPGQSEGGWGRTPEQVSRLAGLSGGGGSDMAFKRTLDNVFTSRVEAVFVYPIIPFDESSHG